MEFKTKYFAIDQDSPINQGVDLYSRTDEEPEWYFEASIMLNESNTRWKVVVTSFDSIRGWSAGVDELQLLLDNIQESLTQAEMNYVAKRVNSSADSCEDHNPA